MGKLHDSIVQHYSREENINFIDDDIQIIYREPILSEIFDVLTSPKTPDLVYIAEDEYVYVGEVKGRFSLRNRRKAYGQVMKYHDILERKGVDNTPFTIVGWKGIEVY